MNMFCGTISYHYLFVSMLMLFEHFARLVMGNRL